MAGLAPAIPEGPVSSQKALKQAPAYQRAKHAIKGDLINGHLASDGCHTLSPAILRFTVFFSQP